MHFYSRWQHGHDAMVKAAYDLIDQADAVVHYNGKKFDIPVLNREFVSAGLTPPDPYKQIDLFQTVRRQFRFLSNGMDAVAEELKLARKTPHKGMALWEGVISGRRADQKIMKEYNIQDIVVLEELYRVLQPWITSHPNRGLYVQDPQSPVCPNCGSTHLQKRGVERPARVNAYQRYKCVDCGANARGRVVIERANENVLA